MHRWLQRLIRTVLPFRRSWRRCRFASMLLRIVPGRFHVIPLVVTIGWYLFGAEGYADTATARVIHFAVGSNDSAQSRRWFRKRRQRRRLCRFFSIRRVIIRFNLLVLLYRRQRGNRRIVDDASLVTVTFFLLVLHIEHLNRFLSGTWLRWRRRWYRSRQRFIRFLNDDLNDRLRFRWIIAQRTLLVQIVTLRAR